MLLVNECIVIIGIIFIDCSNKGRKEFEGEGRACKARNGSSCALARFFIGRQRLERARASRSGRGEFTLGKIVSKLPKFCRTLLGMGHSLSLLACIYPDPLPRLPSLLLSRPHILEHSNSPKRTEFSPWPISRASGWRARGGRAGGFCALPPSSLPRAGTYERSTF